MPVKNKSTDKPILFTGEMIRAMLNGTKTMTRRVVKPQPNSQWSVPPAMLYEGFLNRFGCSQDGSLERRMS